MDPLSIAASIAGLLALGASIVSTGYALCSKAKYDGQHLQLLTNEVAGLSGILLGVRDHARSNSLARSLDAVMEEMLKDCKDCLVQTSALLDKISQENRLSTVLKGDGRDEQMQKLLRRIEHYKSFFILCFQVQQSSDSAALQDQITKIMDAMSTFHQGQIKIDKNIGTLIDKEQLKHLETMVHWLGTPTTQEHEDFCSQRDHQTGTWLIDRPEFESWHLSPGSSFFWLTGTHGSGKSVIVSRIIETLQESGLEASNSALTYHYCRFSNKSSLVRNNLIGSFIGQLLRQCPASATEMLLKIVDDLYTKHQRRSILPSFEELREVFVMLTGYFQTVFIIIDGLDEMEDRWSILNVLEDLTAGDGSFKVFVASRTESDLKDAFSFYRTVTITPNDIAVDLERFVRKEIAGPRFRGSPPSQVEEIVRELLSRADGMFLWVSCQLKHLSSVRTAITTKKLKALPASLEQTYEQTLLRLDPDDRVLARTILQFVMFSQKPLDLTELLESIAITSDATSLSDVKQNRLERPEEVFQICGSLIRESTSTGKLELSHFSVHEFLRTPVLEGKRPNDFCLDGREAYLRLLTASFRYLTLEGLSDAGLALDVEAALDEESHIEPEMFRNTPFLEHAVTQWPRYWLMQSEDSLEGVWQISLLPFFQHTAKYFDFWVKMARYINDPHKYHPGMTPLHAAALHGLTSLAKLLMEDVSLTGCPWRLQTQTTRVPTPLHTAIQNNHDDMVDIFMLPHYIQSTDDKGRTPLHLAVEMGDEVAVTQLITAGADVNCADDEGRTPVFIAIENTWEDLAPSLAKAAKPSVTMPDGRGLLHLAAQTGSTVWASALVEEHDNLVNVVDQEGWTPLHYAVDKSYAGVVKILLSNGARVRVQDPNGWTPLHAAMRHQLIECSELLLTHSRSPLEETLFGCLSPRTIGTRTTGYRSFIERSSMARKYGREAANDNHANHAGASSSSSVSRKSASPSPLSLAMSNGFFGGVKMLLKHADLYGRADIGLSELDGTELQAALVHTDPTLFNLLLSHPEPLSKFLGILPEIAKRRDEKVLALLPRAISAETIHQIVLPGALGLKDLSFATFLLEVWPPSYATLPPGMLFRLVEHHDSEDGLRLAGLLVENGACTDNLPGRTALHVAIQQNHWDMAEFFMSRSVPQSPALATALHMAMQCPSFGSENERRALNLARLLVDRGVDINTLDASRRNICHHAAARDSDTFLRWALENNADPALADASGNTPLHVTVYSAVRSFKSANLKLLLDRIVDTTPEKLVDIFSASGQHGQPMITAIERRSMSILGQLLDADQIANDRTREERPINQRQRASLLSSTLASAIRNEFREGVKALIERMSGLSGVPFQRSAELEPLLHMAVRLRQEETVVLLLDKGVHQGVQQTWNDETPFDIAVDNNLPSIVRILLQQGAECRPKNIISAARHGNMGVLDWVLDKYPDDVENQTKARFEARRHQKADVLEAIRARTDSRPASDSADSITRDAFGDTTLHIAVRLKNSAQVSEIAESAGKDLLEAEDVDGASALLLAIRRCQWGDADILARAGSDIGRALEKAKAAEEADGCSIFIDKLTELKRQYPRD